MKHYDIIYKLSLSHSAGANLRNIIVEYQHFIFHTTIASATSTQCPLIDGHLLVPLFFGV